MSELVPFRESHFLTNLAVALDDVARSRADQRIAGMADYFRRTARALTTDDKEGDSILHFPLSMGDAEEGSVFRSTLPVPFTELITMTADEIEKKMDHADLADEKSLLRRKVGIGAWAVRTLSTLTNGIDVSVLVDAHSLVTTIGFLMQPQHRE